MKHSALLAAALLAGLLARGAAAASDTARPPAQVRVVSAGPESAPRWVPANLGAARRATVSTRLSAAVRAVAVEEGMKVSAGQVLVRLADEDVRAQLAAAQTALANAVLQERRIERLKAQRAATPAELEQAQAQRAQAQAAVSAAQASLGQMEIRAPFAGTVQARRVTAGDFVGPGQPLLEIEGSELEVVATVSEEEARGLALGQKLRFESGGRDGDAEITALAPGGDPLSHRRALRARVRSSRDALISGSFARLSLPAAAARPGVWVPRSALVERGDLTGVFVATGGRAELRWLALGELTGDRVPVRAGLAPGEQVIDAPGALRDGDPIEVLP
jgi:membrane fusion protein, multidrug efflux system